MNCRRYTVPPIGVPIQGGDLSILMIVLLGSCVQLVEELCQRGSKIERRLSSLTGQIQTHDAGIDRQLSEMHRNLATLYESLGMFQKAAEFRRLGTDIKQ